MCVKYFLISFNGSFLFLDHFVATERLVGEGTRRIFFYQLLVSAFCRFAHCRLLSAVWAARVISRYICAHKNVYHYIVDGLS